ncbi:hypothetical protein Tco_1248671 [Tanacetum coccineum]
MFKNVTVNSEGCLDSSTTSQGFLHQLYAFLGFLGLQTNRCEFFLQGSGYDVLDIVYHGNSIPEWFTYRSLGENHVKVELPSEDWCYDEFRGYGTCVVFKCKKPHKLEGYSVYNFDEASIAQNYFTPVSKKFLKREVIGTQDSKMIWLRYTRDTRGWKEAKKFVTFSFFVENDEDVEVTEFGVRLICDKDLEQETDLSMFQSLPTPTTQHGGMLSVYGKYDGLLDWSW